MAAGEFPRNSSLPAIRPERAIQVTDFPLSRAASDLGTSDVEQPR